MDSDKKKLIIKIVSVVCVVALIIGVWSFYIHKTNFNEVAVTTPDGEYVTDEAGEIVTIPREELTSGGNGGGLFGGLFGGGNKQDIAAGDNSSQSATLAGSQGGGLPQFTMPSGGGVNHGGSSGGNQGGSSSDTPTAGWDPADEVTTGKNTETIPELNTPAKIVAYFNNAANGVKKDRPGLAVHQVTSVSFPGLPQNLGTETAKNDQEYKKGTNLINVFPVMGETWSSRLPASGVKSAVCVKDGDKYKIQINLKDEKNPTLENSAIAKCFGILDPKEMEESMKGDDVKIKDFNISYTNCKISAVVDAKTGHMLSAKYYMEVSMKATVVGAPFGLNMKTVDTQNFTMTW